MGTRVPKWVPTREQCNKCGPKSFQCIVNTRPNQTGSGRSPDSLITLNNSDDKASILTVLMMIIMTTMMMIRKMIMMMMTTMMMSL